MSAAILDRLLAGAFEDPDGGAPLSVATRTVAIGAGLVQEAAERVKALELGGRLAVVFDDVTSGVLGERVARALGSIAAIETIGLGAAPHADAGTVDRLCAASAQADALIAVGSGTINDLCKAAARAGNKPYAVFATAPSMNGYTSVTAAITVAGLKKTVPGVAAAGVFLDLDVLSAAPARMIRAGLGDSLCRATCQTDWRLAQAICGAPYRDAPFALLADDEPGLFAEPEALLSGDREAMARLAHTLVLSGFGMAICAGSEPASEGEHLIAHYGDMLLPADIPPPLHGEIVGGCDPDHGAAARIAAGSAATGGAERRERGGCDGPVRPRAGGAVLGAVRTQAARSAGGGWLKRAACNGVGRYRGAAWRGPCARGRAGRGAAPRGRAHAARRGRLAGGVLPRRGAARPRDSRPLHGARPGR